MLYLTSSFCPFFGKDSIRCLNVKNIVFSLCRSPYSPRLCPISLGGKREATSCPSLWGEKRGHVLSLYLGEKREPPASFVPFFFLPVFFFSW
jgi:hypothetical protein